MPTAKNSSSGSKQKKQETGSKVFDEFVQKTWPKVKQELETGLKKTKELIMEGEKQAEKLTDKSIKQLKIVTLNHKKDRHYHDLGKLVAHSGLPNEELLSNPDIAQHLSQIKNIDGEIETLQQQLGGKK